MNDSTEGSRPLSAEEEADLRQLWAEDAPADMAVTGGTYYEVHCLFATLDRERQHHDAVTQDRDDWKRAKGQLKAQNERLAAQVALMQRTIEAAKALDSAWIATVGSQDRRPWERQKQASLAFWNLIVELEQQERSPHQALSYDKCPGCGMTDCLARNSPDEPWVCDRCHWTSSQAESEARTGEGETSER